MENTWSSITYRFELVKENDKFAVNDYDILRNGSYCVKDMKHLLNNSVLRDMDNIYTGGTTERLSLGIQNEVNLYFNK